MEGNLSKNKQKHEELLRENNKELFIKTRKQKGNLIKGLGSKKKIIVKPKELVLFLSWHLFCQNEKIFQ